MKALIDKQDRPILGIVLMVGFCIFAPVIDMFAKMAAENIPILQISAARFLVQTSLLTPFMFYYHLWYIPTWSEAGLQLLRGFLILSATSFFFSAIIYMQIAEALAIFFIEPLILTLLGVILLKETIGWRRVFACFIGFLGALLVIQPKYQEIGLPAMLPLGTAISFSLYLILTRNMSKKMGVITLQTYTGLAGLVIILPILFFLNDGAIAFFDPIMPSIKEVWMLLGVGAAATIAHLFISFAFRFANVSVLAPIQYFEIITATLIGYFVFEQLPDLLTFIGVAIIIASGLYVFFREQQLNKKTYTQIPEL